MASKEEFYLKGIVNEIKELRKSVDKLTAAVKNEPKPKCHYAANFTGMPNVMCTLDHESIVPCVGYDGCDFFTQN